MRRHQGTEPRLLLGQHRAERHLRKLHPVSGAPQPLFKDLYRNSSRKSTPKRIRLEIQQSPSEQKSALASPAEILTSSPPITRSRKIPMGSVELSPRQAAVLQAIRVLTKSNGIPPSKAELVGHLGLKSSAAVDTHIQTLAARAWVATSPGSQRGLTLRREGAPLYEPEELGAILAAPGAARRAGRPNPHGSTTRCCGRRSARRPTCACGSAAARWTAQGSPTAGSWRSRENATSSASSPSTRATLSPRASQTMSCSDGVRGIDTTTAELRPESTSRKHRSARFDTGSDDVEVVGIVIGRMLAGAG